MKRAIDSLCRKNFYYIIDERNGRFPRLSKQRYRDRIGSLDSFDNAVSAHTEGITRSITRHIEPGTTNIQVQRECYRKRMRKDQDAIRCSVLESKSLKQSELVLN